MENHCAMGVTQFPTDDALIDEFVRRHRYLPGNAVAVLDSDRLPLRLQARVRSTPAGATWRAWTNGLRTWLVIARRVHEEECVDVSDVILEMSFYDHDDVCMATAVWLRRFDGKWQLHRVPSDPRDDASLDHPSACSGRSMLRENGEPVTG
jgi:hypothetical protein